MYNTSMNRLKIFFKYDSHKLFMTVIGKLFQTFQNIVHILGQKETLAIFGSGPNWK